MCADKDGVAQEERGREEGKRQGRKRTSTEFHFTRSLESTLMK